MKEEGSNNARPFVVDVPVGISSKEELFDFFSDALCFPSYFGRNWDALEECLADLSWIESARIVIRHATVPALKGDAQIYLDVLKSAQNGACKDLVVILPEQGK